MSETSLTQRMRVRLRLGMSRLAQRATVWGEAVLEVVFFWR